MRICLAIRAGLALLAGLTVGAGLAILTFSPSAMSGRVAWPLVVVGAASLLGAVLLGRSRHRSPVQRAEVEMPMRAPKPGDAQDLVGIVAALDRLQRGHAAHGDSA